MAIFINFTPFSVAETVGVDGTGAEFYTLAAKATFVWDEHGQTQLADAHVPVAEEDVHSGEKGTSSVVVEADLVPVKPRVDVLLVGSIELPTAVDAIEVTLEVGQRIKKSLRVVGERRWVGGGLLAPLLSSPVRFSSMPIEWERSYGGAALDDPDRVELRNPNGRGFARSPRALEGTLAPNFEDLLERPLPVGFGPVGRHWQPRIGFGGTYDARWEEERFPFLPLDFDPRFYNCAPEDQQLDRYLPGEEVRLTYLTRRGHERFLLPDWRVPVTLVDRLGGETAHVLRPDTLLIEPAQRRFSLVGRVTSVVRPNIYALPQVRVGIPPRAWARAQATGKQLVKLGQKVEARR